MLQLLSNATQVGWNVAKTPDSLLLLFRDVQAVQQCKDDPTIVAACMLQSFYEAAMVHSPATPNLFASWIC